MSAYVVTDAWGQRADPVADWRQVQHDRLEFPNGLCLVQKPRTLWWDIYHGSAPIASMHGLQNAMWFAKNFTPSAVEAHVSLGVSIPGPGLEKPEPEKKRNLLVPLLVMLGVSICGLLYTLQPPGWQLLTIAFVAVISILISAFWEIQ